MKYMDILEKEHTSLKDEHAQFKKVYFEQSEEISTLKLNHANREDELMKLKTEIERLKRNANKVEKENEVKLRDIKSEMQNAFKKVGEYVYENEKLQEENRTLKELKKVND